MKHSYRIHILVLIILLTGISQFTFGQEPSINVKQITFGPKNHFFGYIGHVKTIPWNKSGRFIVAMQTDFQDHMPKPYEAADIILIDTQNDYAIKTIDRTLGWNFQQGTMMYWNPDAPETQFFFNDRDPDTNKIFTVLFDISKGKRIREYRYEDTPLGNSGVAQNGKYFLGLNYGRLARLRLVTGYPGAFDWTIGENHPADDGMFKINITTGEKQLLVSFKQLYNAIRKNHPGVEEKALFINHTLWNRDDNRIFFIVRGDFSDNERRLNIPFTINSDGSGLTEQKNFIGGHPEWEFGHRMFGTPDNKLMLYDTDSQMYVKQIGDSSIFTKPGGDKALSPDGNWLVCGYKMKSYLTYILYRLSDGVWLKTQSIYQDSYHSGNLRNDPAPCWNRDGTQVLFPAITTDANESRQLFIIKLSTGEK